MKEETKNGLKKFGKVTAYGFGLFAMLLLGVGLGNCSAKDKRVKANAETALTLDDQKTLRPKRALDPDAWRTLSPDGDNLLLNAEAGHFDLAHSDSLGGYQLVANVSRDTYLLPLQVGQYVIEYRANSADWRGFSKLVNLDGATSVRNAFNGSSGTPNVVFDSDTESNAGFNFQGGYRREVFSVSASFPYMLLMVGNSSAYGVKLSVYDWQTAPAVASYDFPVLFNPYPLGGSPASGDFIFKGPSVNGVTTQTLYINGLSFRSNGKLYNRVMLTYTHDPDQPFGHYDASGNFVNDGTLGSNAWYFRQMLYLHGTDYADVVWNAKYENVDSNLAWKPSLVSGGLWVSQDYRHIEVLSFVNASFQDLPSTSLVANSSVESVLKLISTFVAPSTAEMGNPFTLIREGFSAVGGVLQIQILPFMTLGTLIFVPLVVLVILAILKLLAK